MTNSAPTLENEEVRNVVVSVVLSLIALVRVWLQRKRGDKQIH